MHKPQIHNIKNVSRLWRDSKSVRNFDIQLNRVALLNQRYFFESKEYRHSRLDEPSLYWLRKRGRK
jgi:hypothetical protein